MAISTIVSLVVNILFVLILAIGFLFGFKRGVKRAGLRIGLFLVFVIIGAVISPYITKAILEIKITTPEGTRSTIIKFLESRVRQTQELSNLFTNNGTLASTLNQTIVLVCNFATFIVLALIMTFISWIVFVILAKYVIRDKKRKETIEEIKKNTTNTYDLTPKPEKKYRLWGSLIGVVQGFVLAFILFMPISGLVATAQDVVDTASTTTTTTIVTTAAVEGEEENEEKLPKTLGDLVTKNVPEEYLDIISAYRKTAIGAIASVGDLDKLCFDTITTINVGGHKITLRDELANACNLYEKFVYVYGFDFANNKLSTLNFEDVDALVDGVFSSNFVNAVSKDVVPYAINKLVIQNNNFKLGNYTGLIKGEGQYSDIGLSKYIDDIRKSDIEKDVRELYEVAKLLIKSGIVDDVLDGSASATKILDTITAPTENGTILTQTINHLTTTKTLRFVLNMGFNAGLKTLDDKLSAGIGTSKYNEDVWGVAETDLQNFATNLTSSYTYFNSLNKEVKDPILKFKFNKDMCEALKKVDLNKLLVPASRALDNLNASAVLNQNPNGKEAENKPIIDRIFESIYDSNMFAGAKKYVKLTVANNPDFKFETEISGLVDAINQLIKKDVVSMALESKIDLKALVAKFDTSKDGSVSFDDTLGVVIKSKMFSSSAVTLFNVMNKQVKDLLDPSGELNLTEPTQLPVELDINAQYDDIKAFWNNLIPIAEKVLNESIAIENFDDNDYEKLATFMTGMKENVFNEDGSKKENAVFESIYTNIVEYLKQYKTEATETTESKDYGVYFTGYYESYENKYEVDWRELLTAVRIAVKLNSESEKTISAEDFQTIVDVAAKSEDLQNAVKDAVKEKISDETLSGQVDNLDLTDDTTKNTIGKVVDLATNLPTATDKTNKINQFINDLDEEIGKTTNDEDKTKKQESVDTIVGIVDALADTEIEAGISDISDSDKESIKGAIEGAGNLSDETKDKLKGLFGIGTGEPAPAPEPSDPTPTPGE